VVGNVTDGKTLVSDSKILVADPNTDDAIPVMEVGAMVVALVNGAVDAKTDEMIPVKDVGAVVDVAVAVEVVAAVDPNTVEMMPVRDVGAVVDDEVVEDVDDCWTVEVVGATVDVVVLVEVVIEVRGTEDVDVAAGQVRDDVDHDVPLMFKHPVAVRVRWKQPWPPQYPQLELAAHAVQLVPYWEAQSSVGQAGARGPVPIKKFPR